MRQGLRAQYYRKNGDLNKNFKHKNQESKVRYNSGSI